jgi:hypothetical protein
VEEVAGILTHVARAPFNTRRVRVAPDLVGEEFLGKRLGRREDSLTAHLAQRIADDQWAAETTSGDFMNDIRRAVEHPEARLAVYEARDCLRGDCAPERGAARRSRRRAGTVPGGLLLSQPW